MDTAQQQGTHRLQHLKAAATPTLTLDAPQERRTSSDSAPLGAYVALSNVPSNTEVLLVTHTSAERKRLLASSGYYLTYYTCTSKAD